MECSCSNPDCQFAVLVAFAGVVGLDTDTADQFMFMGTCEGAGHSKLWQYKHYDTRGYLNLDEAGHAYRHHMTGDGDCVAAPYQSVPEALQEALCLSP